MCISYHEVKRVVTDEEKKILFTDDGERMRVYNYTYDSPEYNEWYRVYDRVADSYYERRAQQHREAKRLRQEKELQEKERELFKAAQSLGLQLQPSSCKIKWEHKEQELIHA